MKALQVLRRTQQAAGRSLGVFIKDVGHGLLEISHWDGRHDNWHAGWRCWGWSWSLQWCSLPAAPTSGTRLKCWPSSGCKAAMKIAA